MKKSLLAVTLSCCCAYAIADDAGAISAKLSTLGIGAEYSFPVQENIDIGINTNYFSHKTDFTGDTLTVKGKIKLSTLGVIAYYYPWNDSGFSINGGLYYNANKINLTARPKQDGQTFTINNTVYSTDQIDSPTGEITFNKIAPYLGVSWKSGDRHSTGLAFGANVGVMFHGAPSTSLQAKCNIDNAQFCDKLKENLETERDNISVEANHYTFYPVASVGLIYRF